MNTFEDVVPGDELWVINGHQNSTFEANVITVTDQIIEVEVPEKDSVVYTFDSKTGQALEGPFVSRSFLARDDDWRVRVILDRKEHNWFHETLVNLASEFKWDPTPENSKLVQEHTEKWLQFVAGADRLALVSNSVQEYTEARNDAEAPPSTL